MGLFISPKVVWYSFVLYYTNHKSAVPKVENERMCMNERMYVSV